MTNHDTNDSGRAAAGSTVFGSLRLDVTIMLGSRFAGVALAIVNSIVVARTLGPGGRGALAVSLSLILILVQLGNLGFSTANPYYAARDRLLVPRIVANSVWLAAAGGILLVGAGLLLKLLAPTAIRGVDWVLLGVALAGVPAGLAGPLLQSVLLAQGRSIAYNGVDVGLAVATVAITAVALLVFDLGVQTAVAIAVVRLWAGAIVYAVLLARRVNVQIRPDLRLLRMMARYAFRIYVATLLAFLVIRADLMMVNGYLGASQAGLYSIAITIADTLYILPTAVALNLFPRIADHTEPAEMTAAVFRSVFVGYGVVCILACVLCGPAIHVLYGPAFEGAASLFRWLAPGIFCLGMLNILAHHFAGRGFPLQAMLVWFVGVVIVVAMNVALLASHGTYIAALSSSIAYAVLLLLHIRLFAREIGTYSALRPARRDFRRLLSTILRLRPSVKS